MILICSSLLTGIVVVILSLESNGVRFSWDSDTLYQFIYSLGYDSLADAHQLMFMQVHASVVYAYILVLFKFLFGNLRFAFWLLNAICIFAASFGSTFLYRYLMPQKKTTMYVFANFIFMFSPWVCGMSTYYIYDFLIYCFFPLLMYFYCRKNWIGFSSIGILIVFSRAPGIVIFGSVCVAMLINEILQMRKKDPPVGLRQICKQIVFDPKYWFFISIAVVFLGVYLSGRDTNRKYGDVHAGIDIQHIIHLLKIFTLSNYLWIFFLLTIVLFIFVFLLKKQTVSDRICSFVFVIGIADILLILFYCLAVTYRMPRYMDSHISVLFICGTLLLLLFRNEWVFYATSFSLSVLLFIASFRMIDPVSLAVFRNINVGDHNIVQFENSKSDSFGDAIICNREYYSYEVLLGKAMTYVVSDKEKDDEIMFSLGEQDSTWGFSGGRYSWLLREGRHYFAEFYDKRINGMANGYNYEYNDSTDMIPVDIHYIFPKETVEEALKISDSEFFYYIYMPTLNAEKEKEIYQKFDILEEKQFEFRGWKMNCIKFGIRTN